jgi:hypothetical protein
MAITIPDRTQIRITTDFDKPNNGHALPAFISTVAITNPGPVAIDPVNGPDAKTGQTNVIQAAGAAGAGGYVGYNPDTNIPAGGPCSPARSSIVDGFAGATQGSPVYVDATGADAGGTASGLSHTPNGQQIGVAITPTRIFFY